MLKVIYLCSHWITTSQILYGFTNLSAVFNNLFVKVFAVLATFFQMCYKHTAPIVRLASVLFKCRYWYISRYTYCWFGEEVTCCSCFVNIGWLLNIAFPWETIGPTCPTPLQRTLFGCGHCCWKFCRNRPNITDWRTYHYRKSVLIKGRRLCNSKPKLLLFVSVHSMLVRLATNLPASQNWLLTIILA